MHCLLPLQILEDIVTHHGSVAAFDNKLKLLFLLEPLDMQADLEVRDAATWSASKPLEGMQSKDNPCCSSTPHRLPA